MMITADDHPKRPRKWPAGTVSRPRRMPMRSLDPGPQGAHGPAGERLEARETARIPAPDRRGRRIAVALAVVFAILAVIVFLSSCRKVTEREALLSAQRTIAPLSAKKPPELSITCTAGERSARCLAVVDGRVALEMRCDAEDCSILRVTPFERTAIESPEVSQ